MDKIILLEDNKQNLQNLNLTYGVMDGVISHCGEIDENSLKPREEYIDLYEYIQPNQYKPFTWEGCVVKIADKIAYLGRDIQDAITIGILDEHLEELYNILDMKKTESINNTIIINNLVYDLCENSSEEKGLNFSDEIFYFMNKLKKFNYKYIYSDERLKPSTEYFELIIKNIYYTLKRYFKEKEHMKAIYPEIINEFEAWLKLYWNQAREEINKNDVIFDVENEKDLCQAIIYYISGMTDNYAINTYNKIIRF